jgi:hypothetical protein
MISTPIQAEMPYNLDDGGERLWSYAHMNLTIPWFFVEYESEAGGQTIKSVIMLFMIGHLEQLSLDSTISINYIYLVSPGYVNHSNKWSMDVIKSISIGLDKNDLNEQRIIKYELKNNTYYYPEIENPNSYRKILDIYIY